MGVLRTCPTAISAAADMLTGSQHMIYAGHHGGAVLSVNSNCHGSGAALRITQMPPYSHI